MDAAGGFFGAKRLEAALAGMADVEDASELLTGVRAAIADFTPHADTPDSLKAWSAFGRRVLVLEFRTSGGASYMDLDDIRIR